MDRYFTTTDWTKAFVNNNISCGKVPVTTTYVSCDSYVGRREENVLDRIKIRKIEESTKTEIVKIPQYKAAPKKESREYKIVTVTFTSGHVQEAICMPGDDYDLSRGIEVCIMKELFGGTKAYNDFMRKTVKDYKDGIKRKERREAKAAEDKAIAERRKAKNEKRKAELEAKKKAAKRQEKIDIQAEAFLKAMQMYDEFALNEASGMLEED